MIKAFIFEGLYYCFQNKVDTGYSGELLWIPTLSPLPARLTQADWRHRSGQPVLAEPVVERMWVSRQLSRITRVNLILEAIVHQQSSAICSKYWTICLVLPSDGAHFSLGKIVLTSCSRSQPIASNGPCCHCPQLPRIAENNCLFNQALSGRDVIFEPTAP